MFGTIERFKREKIGKLRKKKKIYSTRLSLFWVICFLIISLFILGTAFFPIVSYFLPILFLLIIISFGVFFKKIEKIGLNPKEKILLNLYNGIFYLDKYKQNPIEKNLKLSKISLSKLIKDLNDSFFGTEGIKVGDLINNFSKELILLLKDLINKLKLGILEENYEKIESILLNLFIYIEEENFNQALKLIKYYNKENIQKQQKKNKLRGFFSKIEDSPLLKIFLYLLIIVIFYLLAWFLFFLISKPYPHLIILGLIIVIVFGFKNEIDKLIFKT